jgi:hypothetical protein
MLELPLLVELWALPTLLAHVEPTSMDPMKVAALLVLQLLVLLLILLVPILLPMQKALAQE